MFFRIVRRTSSRRVRDLVIIGAGGFGREVAWLVEVINADSRTWNLLGFVDDDQPKVGQLLNGVPVLGTTAWLSHRRLSDLYVAVSLGDPVAKKRLVQGIASTGVKFATLIHPQAHISRFVDVGGGTVVCASTVLTVNVKIGNHVGINPGCTVGHDSHLYDYCSLMPGVHIAGNVSLGEGAYVGTAAAVIQGVTVGQWTVVGAGAVVTNDLCPNLIAVGIPAKPIKPHLVE